MSVNNIGVLIYRYIYFMKKDIHPKYYPKSKVHCACGASFEVGSTKEVIETEVCGNCHPFYTGKDKIIDTAGRVDKYKKRLAKKETMKPKQKKPRKSNSPS